LTASGPSAGAPASLPLGGPSAPPAPGATPPPARAGNLLLDRLQAAIGANVIGYGDAVEALTIALSCDGHVLLEGLPGLAKTYLVRSFARALDLSFRRIQFTPDMLPLDIVGNVVLSPKTHDFEFRPGPVFCNVLLADEINRAPPKVQSALLESMQEFQVTVDGRSYPLPRPFLVIATQNPLDQEGTYPLPESQLDRFLFRPVLHYPGREDEIRILTTQEAERDREVAPRIVSPTEIDALRAQHRTTFVQPDLLEYIADLVRETRTDPRVLVGASPRAGVHLMIAARGMAILEGRRYVLPDDIRALAFSVLNHRIILRREATRAAPNRERSFEALGLVREVIESIVNRVPVPR
jgi:MoxR-like ATPase